MKKIFSITFVGYSEQEFEIVLPLATEKQLFVIGMSVSKDDLESQ